MSAERATGLVVRATDWSETSRIVTLWTREFGKVRALAKGGRRLNSSFEVALDLLTACDIVLLRKTSGGLDLLTEARVSERFPALRTALPAYYAGCYLAELLADWTAEADPHPELYDAAVAALREFGRPGADVPLATAGFEVAFLRESGHGPALAACAACGGDPGLAPAFGPTAGGVLCPGCAPGQRDRRPLSAAALGAMRTMQAGAGCDPPPGGGVRAELRRVLGEYVTCRLGRRPKLLAYVEGA